MPPTRPREQRERLGVAHRALSAAILHPLTEMEVYVGSMSTIHAPCWLWVVAHAPVRCAGLRARQPDHPRAAQPEVDRRLPGQVPLQPQRLCSHRAPLSNATAAHCHDSFTVYAVRGSPCHFSPPAFAAFALPSARARSPCMHPQQPGVPALEGSPSGTPTLRMHLTALLRAAQVGDADIDHGNWARPEEMTYARPVDVLDAGHPGLPPCACTAVWPVSARSCHLVLSEKQQCGAVLL